MNPHQGVHPRANYAASLLVSPECLIREVTTAHEMSKVCPDDEHGSPFP